MRGAFGTKLELKDASVLAVLPEYRRQGIAKLLIRATKEKANCLGLPCIGLLVDKGNDTTICETIFLDDMLHDMVVPMSVT